MMEAMEPVYAALKYADSRTSAYIISEVYQIARENELFELDSAEFMVDLLSDLRYILEKDANLFSTDEYRRYIGIVEE